MNRLLIALLFAGACFGQVGPLPDALFPAFFNNLNTALGTAVATTGTYTNPSWLVSIPYTKVTGMSATAPIVYSGGVFSCAVATGSVPGCISAADWTKFNSATSAGTPLQKGDGSGGFVSSSLSDNGTTVSTAEAFSAKAITTGDATASGGSCFTGFTSGTVCWVVGNTATGTDVAYILPTTIGAANQVLMDNGSTTCPTLGAGAPATCHATIWVATTGTGNFVRGTAPTITLANGTGLPLNTGVTGTLPVANGGTGTASPGIVAGTNVTVTGTWPNQTVNSSGGGGGGIGTVICSSNTATSTTSATTETNLTSCTIPAGTLTTTSRVVIYMVYKFVGVTNTKTATVRLSATNGDVSGSGNLAVYSAATNANTLSLWQMPEFINVNSVSSQYSTGGGFGNSTLSLTGTVNTASTSYINFNCAVTNASDTCALHNYSVVMY